MWCPQESRKYGRVFYASDSTGYLRVDWHWQGQNGAPCKQPATQLEIRIPHSHSIIIMNQMQAPTARPQRENSPTCHPNTPSPQVLLCRQRTEVVNTLARLLNSTRPSQSAISALFSTDDSSIALVIPSLELEDNNDNNSKILPAIGEHSEIITSHDDTTTTRPDMAASVLSKDLDNSPSPAEITKSLSRRTCWTKSTLAYACGSVTANVTQSFHSLTNFRLKSWTLVLLRHSLSTGCTQSRSRLMGMLSTQIEVAPGPTKFQTLPLPESAQGLKPKDCDLILPLLFEGTVKVTTKKKKTTEDVHLRCPGTIACTSETKLRTAVVSPF